MFPQSYDWRYRVISNLLSPRDNPGHYWLPACGLALAAFFMLPFAGYLQRHFKISSPRVACISCGTFIAGIVTLVCTCLVVPQHTHGVFGVRRMHEFLARSSAAFLAVAMLCGCWCALKNRRQSVFAARLFWTWSFLTLLPLVGILFSECLLLLTRPTPWWAMPIRNALRYSVFWHLGFWEWTGAAAVFLFLCAAVFLTPRQAVLEDKVHEGQTVCVDAKNGGVQFKPKRDAIVKNQG